jgi:hypothetical protein
MSKKKGFEDTLNALMSSTPDTPPARPQISITDKREKDETTVKVEKEYRVDYDSLPKTTTTISFRVPRDEKTRLSNYFKKKFGTSLADGVKRVIYEYVNENPLK